MITYLYYDVSSSKHIPVEGSEVSLPCIVAPGSFPTERWIKVNAEADKKPLIITAFVPLEYVKDSNPTSKSQRSGHVTTYLRFRKENNVALLFPGELLSSTNPVRVSADWLLKVSNGKPKLD